MFLRLNFQGTTIIDNNISGSRSCGLDQWYIYQISLCYILERKYALGIGANGGGVRGRGRGRKREGEGEAIQHFLTPSIRVYLVTLLPLPLPSFLFVFHQSGTMVNYFITDFLQLLLEGGDRWRVMAIQGHSKTGKSSQSDYLPISMVEKECLLRKPVEQCSVV